MQVYKKYDEKYVRIHFENIRFDRFYIQYYLKNQRNDYLCIYTIYTIYILKCAVII